MAGYRKNKKGDILYSHTTKTGLVVRYQVVDVADGVKMHGHTYSPFEGTLIVRKMRKDGTLTGKKRLWAASYQKPMER